MSSSFVSITAFFVSDHTVAAHLPVILLLVFGTAKLLAEVCERLGQPGIVGEILAGVLLGPGILNWVQPDEVLASIAQLGVMFLLFRVGLEIRASELFSVGGTALAVAAGGIALPFVAGWMFMSALGVRSIEAIFVGAAMVATSVGITAQVLAANGLLGEISSRVILAAAVIDDVLGLLVLAVVTSFAQNHVNIPSLLVTGALASVFTLLVAKFGTRTMRHIVPHVEQRLSVKEAQLNLVLIALFALSVLAVYIGVAAIVGAFLAGLAFSETVNARVKDLANGITELLVPFFLAGIGLQLRLSDFSHRKILLVAIVLTAIAVITKAVGCGLAAFRLGRKDALRVGIGMVPRGEVGMVVAQIGVGLGIIEKSVFGVIVFMAVATTLIAPPLLKLVFRGVERAVQSEQFTLG